MCTVECACASLGGRHRRKWVIDSGEYTLLVVKDSEHAETSGPTGTFVMSGD